MLFSAERVKLVVFGMICGSVLSACVGKREENLL